MPETVEQTMGARVGPLPIWVWIGGGAVGIGGFLYYRNKKKQQQQAQQQAQQGTPVASNLNTTTPVSNLTTQAQPMPIQLGDTFVNTPGQQTIAPAPSPITGPPLPSAGVLTPASMPPAPEAPMPPPPASGGVQTG
jgi:hypothetical protein